MSHDVLIYALALVVGVVAGVINTLAGSGSTLTLPMLVFMGLPAELANGTNRVGILFQNVVGIVTLRRAGKLPLDATTWRLLVPSVLGGALGALVAADLSTAQMNLVIAGAMLLVLGLLFVHPGRWTADVSVPKVRPWLYPALFVVGFYGGFVQAGVGVLLLAALIFGGNFDSVTANGLKLVLTLMFTAVALPVFAWHGQVDWWVGGLMAVGQGAGAYLAARFATQVPNAGVYIRWLLIVVIVATLAKVGLTLV